MADSERSTSLRLSADDLARFKEYKRLRYGDLAEEVTHQRAFKDLLEDAIGAQKVSGKRRE